MVSTKKHIAIFENTTKEIYLFFLKSQTLVLTIMNIVTQTLYFVESAFTFVLLFLD